MVCAPIHKNFAGLYIVTMFEVKMHVLIPCYFSHIHRLDLTSNLWLNPHLPLNTIWIPCWACTCTRVRFDLHICDSTAATYLTYTSCAQSGYLWHHPTWALRYCATCYRFHLFTTLAPSPTAKWLSLLRQSQLWPHGSFIVNRLSLINCVWLSYPHRSHEQMPHSFVVVADHECELPLRLCMLHDIQWKRATGISGKRERERERKRERKRKSDHAHCSARCTASAAMWLIW